MINPSIVSALSVLAGSSVGALTPVLSNYVLQRSATQRDFANREVASRQTLYSDFITEATRLYGEALTRNNFELNDAVGLYALVSRIRLFASSPVVVAAEDVATTIMDRYGAVNMTLEELRKTAVDFNSNRLFVFSTVCRNELRELLELSAAGLSPKHLDPKDYLK